jgi:hypothetical protein
MHRLIQGTCFREPQASNAYIECAALHDKESLDAAAFLRMYMPLGVSVCTAGCVSLNMRPSFWYAA